jgi:hypothetical protein
VVDSLTYADEEGGEPYFHDQIVYCDDTPDSKIQMSTYRRDLGIRIHAARKARMRRLSYEWLAGLREIVIDSKRCPLTFAEFTLKEFERDREGNFQIEFGERIALAISSGCSTAIATLYRARVTAT